MKENKLPYISEPFVSTKGHFVWSEAFEGSDGREARHLIYEGEFQKADVPNKNRRIYETHILERENNSLMDFIRLRNGLPMGMDHPLPRTPDDVASVQKLAIEHSCAMITHLEMASKTVYGKANVLDESSHNGAHLRSLIRAGNNGGFKPAVSSRGLGSNPTQRGQFWHVPEDFHMITYDMVTDPSVETAILKMLSEQNEYIENVLLQTYHPKASRKFFDVMIDLSKKHGGIDE